jgi:bifunctional DNA-binding transcriptional regulator/antitoxin component of YhaV-PrlF toxin-antitoxin module
MATHVGPEGEVVISKAFRDALGLQPGVEVVLTLEDEAVRVERARSRRSLEGSLRGRDLVGALERDRRAGVC